MTVNITQPATSFTLSPENVEKARIYIKTLRDEYLKAPTYLEGRKRRGVVQIDMLDNKYLHRNWWEEFYPELFFGGDWLRTYYDEVLDYVTELCAEQLGVRSEHRILLEEDDTWYDYSDPAAYRWDRSLAPNSTENETIDDYADGLTDELLEDFAIEGAPDFTVEALELYAASENDCQEENKG